MDNFEWNKIAASVLVVLLVIKGGEFFSRNVVVSSIPEQKGYFVDVSEAAITVTGDDKGLPPIAPLMEKADIKNGERIFKAKCTQCHVINSNGVHVGQGPNLWGVTARKIAQIVNYAYSSAFKKKSDLEWSVEHLNQYLYKPQKFIRGTKMSFAGLSKEQERADVIAYLAANQ
jgi:cytochrome c